MSLFTSQVFQGYAFTLRTHRATVLCASDTWDEACLALIAMYPDVNDPVSMVSYRDELRHLEPDD